ncbi:MAG: DUF2244 domain-containing protein [Burkholderiaceae bacterium]
MSAAERPAAGQSTQYRWRFDRIGGPGEDIRQWVLARNCALGPRQLGACIAGLVAVTLLVGLMFASHGYWVVLPFAGIETLALAASFLVYSRHAADRERIVAAGDRLVVEWTCGKRVSRMERIGKWVRVDYGGRQGDLVRLIVAGSTIEVGRYVPGERRGMLAHELRSVLAQERRHCRQGV